MHPNDPHHLSNPYTSDYNPYQAPEMTEYDSDQEMQLLDEPNRLSAGEGMAWITEAWRIFLARPWLWVLSGLCYIVILLILSWIPVVNIFAGVVNVFLMAGMAYMAYLVDMNEDVSLGDMFVGFKERPTQLFVLFLLNLVCVVIIIIPFAVVMGVGLNPDTLASSGLGFIMLLFLVMLAVMLPLVMAMVFSPILVLFHELRPIEAMKLSFRACLRNIMPFLVYGIVMTLLGIVAMIPFGLGYFVILPMGFIAIYVAYRQILLGHQ